MRIVSYILLSGMFLAACNHAKEGETTATDSLPPTQHIKVEKTIDPADGPYTENYPGGGVKIEGEIKNGKRFGLWKSYYPSGNKQSEDYFEDGLKNGKTVTFYKNGRMRYIGYFTWDKPSGQWEFYDTTGAVTTKKEYK